MVYDPKTEDRRTEEGAVGLRARREPRLVLEPSRSHMCYRGHLGRSRHHQSANALALALKSIEHMPGRLRRPHHRGSEHDIAIERFI